MCSTVPHTVTGSARTASKGRAYSLRTSSGASFSFPNSTVKDTFGAYTWTVRFPAGHPICRTTNVCRSVVFSPKKSASASCSKPSFASLKVSTVSFTTITRAYTCCACTLSQQLGTRSSGIAQTCTLPHSTGAVQPQLLFKERTLLESTTRIKQNRKPTSGLKKCCIFACRLRMNSQFTPINCFFLAWMAT